jgi:hypothetical protein
MPPVLSPISYEPIKAVQVLSQQGATPAALRTPEAAIQTFNIGVPIRLVAGYTQECTFGAADTVYGVSSERAHNYTNAGGGVTFGLPYTIPPSVELNEPASSPPPNQPSAVVIPMGAAPRDGQLGLYEANGQTVFSIALKVGQVFTIGLLIPGTLYGLTKDGTSTFWFLDTTVVGGNSGVASLIGMDPNSPNDGVNGTRVFFQFASARRAF